LHAPFEDSQGNDKHGKKNDAAALRDPQESPEADGAKRPGFGIASKKEKCREAKKGQRPIARPGNFSCLRRERQQSIERTTMPAQ